MGSGDWFRTIITRIKAKQSKSRLTEVRDVVNQFLFSPFWIFRPEIYFFLKKIGEIGRDKRKREGV